MGLDQYLDITITTPRPIIKTKELQTIKENLKSILPSHSLENIYDINPEYSNLDLPSINDITELEPVVNIDGYNTDTYELFDIRDTKSYYRKVNQIQNYFEERFYEDGNDYDSDDYNNVVTKVDDLTIDDIIDRIDTIESSENREKTAKKEFPTTEGFFYGSTEYDQSYFVSNDEFKHDLIELQKIRNEINQKLENTDYHAIITYSSWW